MSRDLNFLMIATPTSTGSSIRMQRFVPGFTTIEKIDVDSAPNGGLTLLADGSYTYSNSGVFHYVSKLRNTTYYESYDYTLTGASSIKTTTYNPIYDYWVVPVFASLSANRKVWAVERDRKDYRWQYSAGSNITASCVDSDGDVYVTAEDSTLKKLNGSTGALVWSSTLGIAHLGAFCAVGYLNDIEDEVIVVVSYYTPTNSMAKVQVFDKDGTLLKSRGMLIEGTSIYWTPRINCCYIHNGNILLAGIRDDSLLTFGYAPKSLWMLKGEFADISELDSDFLWKLDLGASVGPDITDTNSTDFRRYIDMDDDNNFWIGVKRNTILTGSNVRLVKLTSLGLVDATYDYDDIPGATYNNTPSVAVQAGDFPFTNEQPFWNCFNFYYNSEFEFYAMEPVWGLYTTSDFTKTFFARDRGGYLPYLLDITPP